MSNNHNNFYAVNKGRAPGVYLTWEECKEQVDNFKFPVYRKFKTFEEALEFVNTKPVMSPKVNIKNQNNISTASTSTSSSDKIYNNPEHKVFFKDYTYIFCDGSAMHHNYKSIRCGFGVCIIKPMCEIINHSIKINDTGTNNLAELNAILFALAFIEKNKITKSFLICDSTYAMDCVLVWSITWKKNNWLTSKKTVPENSEVIKAIIEKYETLIGNNYIINFKHINSHQSKPREIDTFSYFLWFGNDQADKLAKGEDPILDDSSKPTIHLL